MLVSKLTLPENAEFPAELTVRKFDCSPVELTIVDDGYTTSIELDTRQVQQLMHFLNIILETN